jgi:hypothetical protein
MSEGFKLIGFQSYYQYFFQIFIIMIQQLLDCYNNYAEWQAGTWNSEANWPRLK